MNGVRGRERAVQKDEMFFFILSFILLYGIYLDLLHRVVNLYFIVNSTNWNTMQYILRNPLYASEKEAGNPPERHFPFKLAHMYVQSEKYFSKLCLINQE